MWKKGLISPIFFCALRERKGVALFLKNLLSPFSFGDSLRVFPPPQGRKKVQLSLLLWFAKQRRGVAKHERRLLTPFPKGAERSKE